MRVAVIVVFVSVLTTASEASRSCMSKTEARQHFGSVHIYWHGRDHCWDATPTNRQHRVRTVQRIVDRPKWHDSMSKMLSDAAPVQAAPSVQAAAPPQAAPWGNRWVDIESSPIDSRWVDIVQVAPPPIIRNAEPMVTSRGVVMVMVMVIIITTLTLLIFGVLFGGIKWAGPYPQRR